MKRRVSFSRVNPKRIKRMRFDKFLTRRCVNLRKDQRRERLIPIPKPEKWIDDASLPFFSTRVPQGEYALFYRDGALCYAQTDVASPRLHEIVQMESSPLCAVEISSGVIEVMTRSGRLYIYIKENGAVDCLRDGVFPTITFAADERMTLAMPVDSCKFSGTYDLLPTQLTGADAAAFTKPLKASYLRLSDLAQAGGMLIQPVFIRYKLLDAENVVIYCSEPVMLAPGGGFQCCGRFEATLNDDGGYRSLSLSADVSRLNVTVPRFADGRVRKIIIESTPPIHPFDFARPAETSIINSGGARRMRFFLPGVSVAMVEGEKLLEKLLEDVRHRGDSAFVRIGELSPMEGTYTINPSPASNTEQQLAVLKKLLQTPVVDNVALLNKPFTAGAVCCVAGKMVYGDLMINGQAKPDAIMVVERDNRYYSGPTLDCGIGCIVAIHEMERRRESLSDYSRSRVYLFGTKGIAIAVLSSAGTITGVNIIDRRGVMSGHHISRTTSPDYQLAVIAQGELLLLNGTKISEPSDRLRGLKGVAGDMASKDLWILDGDNRPALIDSAMEYVSDTDFGPIESLTGLNGTPVFYSDETLFAIGDNYDGYECRLTLDIDAQRDDTVYELPRRLSRLTAEIAGKTEGTLTVRCSNAPSDEYVTVCNVDIAGDFNAPLSFPVLSPLRRFYRLDFRLKSSADLAISKIEAAFSPVRC